jgi:Cytochrome C oxidase, cbb3-type, subunit III
LKSKKHLDFWGRAKNAASGAKAPVLPGLTEELRPRPSMAGGTPALRAMALATARSTRVFGLAALALLFAGCRMDMHEQPKYLPYEPTTFFDDGRSERPVVPGTVARGQLRLDELLYTGKENGVVANKFPFPITREDLERGRQRYNIYCTPCHDYTGSGRGIVVQRGFPPPPSFHIDRLRQAPAGHFFDVMSNGYGSMYSYASRVEPEDRWRIAAYIRVLQLSEHATEQDVPQADRAKLNQQSAGQSQ